MGCKPTNDGSSQGACSKDVIETNPPCGKTVDGRVPHVGSAAQILPQICLFACLDQTLDLQYFDPPLFDNPDLSSLNPKLIAVPSSSAPTTGFRACRAKAASAATLRNGPRNLGV